VVLYSSSVAAFVKSGLHFCFKWFICFARNLFHDTLIHFLSLSVALRILIGERLAVENVHHTFAHKPLL
jgi:hypothetical protein